MNAITFGAPQWFWGMLALPLLALLFERAERRGARRLEAFASPRLLPRLTGTVNRFRRALQFGLLLATVGFVITALARPQWGYTYEEVKRKGVDLIFAVDTSRSMLSNDVQPNRLERVKLAAQDLVNELRGDRVGLVAFAGRAFLQAPLTIDYGAAIDSINDLDTKTIPEGGTNISEAISLATRTYGKSAVGNRALVIFTDGEELNGDALKTAKTAAEAGVRIFTVGVGTPEGSLIPLQGEGGGTAFVKDSKGQVVKSKLDEARLREIAEATQGFYLHLENGPRTMRQLFTDGLSKMQAGDIDERMSRKPIDRYQWPLAAALVTLTSALLINDRKRGKSAIRVARAPQAATAAAIAVLLMCGPTAKAKSPGLDLYEQQKFPQAFQQFEQALKDNPNARQADRIQFDAGAAAYKMKDYNKALESFSQALLSPDVSLQAKSHYNLGNTLYQRGEAQKADANKVTDWTNALQHYEQTLKAEPENKEAKENLEFVKNKIEELKTKQEQKPTPTPTPSPSPNQKDKKDQKKSEQQQDQKQDKQDQQQQQQQQQQQKSDQDKNDDQSQQQKKDSDQQQKDQNGGEQKPEDKPGSDKDKQSEKNGSPGPSATPGEDKQQPGQSPSPSPSAGEKGDDKSKAQPSPAEQQPDQSPTPGSGGENSPSPSPSPGEGSEGEGDESGATPTATPSGSPKKLTGDVKGTKGDVPPDNGEEPVEIEPVKEGEMNEQQARQLLQAMRDEEQKVQLDERKRARRVYNDW